MKRSVLSVAFGVALVVATAGPAGAAPPNTRSRDADDAHGRGAKPADHRTPTAMPKGYLPAAAAQARLGRYFVVLRAPSVAEQIAKSGGAMSANAQRQSKRDATAAQDAVVAAATSLGGTIVFRYGTLVNGFSAHLTPAAAKALARRPDVASVQPASIVLLDNASSVPFIGATEVWDHFGARGQGLRLALVDTGIDYTHKDFGGPGTVAAYNHNDPNIVEPGTFPTAKVIGGYDFVGGNYNVLDDDPTNDIPRPDFDPLDRDGHGSHTGGTCCGIGVAGGVGPGVAPDVKILAYKVWDRGNSTDDVLVAAYERAVDPNQDGDTSDRADVLSFSGGVDYGTLNSVEAVAAQRVVDLGTIFVASAGNAGNQPSGGSAYITGTPANARGVISVAASRDEFLANRLVIDSPSVSLPDDGVAIHQSWSGDFSSDLSGRVLDARQFDPPAVAGPPTPADRQLCDTTPAGSFGGSLALVYKGSTGAGDCTGTEKVYRAQQMGASAVILWNGFGGFPFDLSAGDFADLITIPAVMLSGDDSEALADATSPAPPAYNAVDVEATITAAQTPVAAFTDSMADFSSEGPARITNDLKPDITAPGVDIESAGVGTGDGGALLSGTSMAAPHVSGVAILLRQLHPGWSPARIKALMQNHAVRAMKNADLSEGVPATVMGAGRVAAFASATAVSLAWPGSLSFGFMPSAQPISRVRSFRVQNVDTVSHDYSVAGKVRYSDYDPSIAAITYSLDGSSFASTRTFSLAPGASRTVWAKLRTDPSVISTPEQLYDWYGFHPNLDGTIAVTQDAPHHDILKVAWHVVPLATARNGVSATSLDLTGGAQTMTMTEPAASGLSFADLYLLGATDGLDSQGEEDITAVGARTFVGQHVNGSPVRLPTGTDALGGLTWQEFVSGSDEPTEPVEFVVQSAAMHDTAATLEVDVLVDAGADGVFADPELQADYLVVKNESQTVCVFDLSLADPFADCTASYYADYAFYDTNLAGLVVDASAIGLSDARPTLSYHVMACTGRFSGDVPGQFCDEAGGFSVESGTWDMELNVTDPALRINHLVCQGFWGGATCDSGDPIRVQAGSAGAGDDPSILVVFPNDRPKRDPTIVATGT